MKRETQGGFWAAILALIRLISDFFRRKDEQNQQQAEQNKQQEIAKAKDELQKALAEGRIQDAAYWRAKLQQLTAILLLCLLMTGCVTDGTTTPPQQPPPVVQISTNHIIRVFAGERVVVPPLPAKATQWVLADNTGLFEIVDANVVAYGDRIRKVSAGDVIAIQPPISPAKQWYLATDFGLKDWLGIDLGKAETEQPTRKP